MNLLERIKLLTAGPAAGAATTTINGATVIDTAGYDGCVIVVSLGDVTDTSVLGLQIQGNSGNSTLGMADITGAAATYTAGASNADEKQMAVDVYKPTAANRYLRPVITRGTANAVIKGVIAILYRGRSAPAGLVGDLIAGATANG